MHTPELYSDTCLHFLYEFANEGIKKWLSLTRNYGEPVCLEDRFLTMLDECLLVNLVEFADSFIHFVPSDP